MQSTSGVTFWSINLASFDFLTSKSNREKNSLICAIIQYALKVRRKKRNCYQCLMSEFHNFGQLDKIFQILSCCNTQNFVLSLFGFRFSRSKEQQNVQYCCFLVKNSFLK